MSDRIRVGILGTIQGPHVQSLVKAFGDLGTDVAVLPPTRLTSHIPGRTEVSDAKGPAAVEDLDALLVRSLPGGSLEQVIYRVNVLHRLEQAGLRVINRAETLEKTVDKFYTLALLATAGLPVPRTVVTERHDQAMQAVADLGAVVVKPLFGSLGTGMTLVDDREVAYRVFRALEMGRYVFYLQEFLPHDNEDFRIFVLDGQIAGAMRRRGKGWKTNIACGGVAEYFEPDAVLADLALKTAAILNADYVGVDILISQGKPYILEANGIPGWSGLQTVCPVDIAGLLARYVARAARLDKERRKSQPGRPQ
ncbi:MAG: RimK family alpha-L-glutamate ligase [Negativicutes bacterium]|nr:RimK family alpha-L-glutamate ligase [Negativicutes bacterium]